MADTAEKQQLVTLARSLERKLAQRRKVVKRLTVLDDEIRTCRKLVRDLTTPDPTEAYQPLPDGHPVAAAI